MHVSCTRRTLGGAHFYIALERCAYLVFGRLVLGVSPLAGWPCAIREQSSAACFAPSCGVLLRFFARVLRVVNALKSTLGVASKASGWRPSLCWRTETGACFPRGKQCRALACSGMLINQHANKCTGVHKNPCGIFIKSLGQSCFSKKQDIERRTGCVLIHMLHVN